MGLFGRASLQDFWLRSSFFYPNMSSSMSYSFEKKIKTRGQLHKIHQASQRVPHRQCFHTFSLSCTKITHHATRLHNISFWFSRDRPLIIKNNLGNSHKSIILQKLESTYKPGTCQTYLDILLKLFYGKAVKLKLKIPTTL
jgi:hypothetical protein